MTGAARDLAVAQNIISEKQPGVRQSLISSFPQRSKAGIQCLG
jgi:hypothetical protein